MREAGADCPDRSTWTAALMSFSPDDSELASENVDIVLVFNFLAISTCEHATIGSQTKE